MEKENSAESFSVIDMENRKFHITEEIARGGQGIVYHEKDDMDIAIKIVTDSNGEPVKSEEAIKEISERLSNIRRLPIPKGINLSRPLAILKSHAGYIMTFMNGMKSFEIFLQLKKDVEEVPDWLCDKNGHPIANAGIWANYCYSGGLRTRLLSLYKVSELLALLHTSGLVYGDISCGNLMYKESEGKIIGGLIDADNINFAGNGKTYFTPSYGAPEIVTDKSCATIFSDSYAFAVAAFYILTMNHPFKGAKFLGESNDGWSKTATQNQNANEEFRDDGSFPWIFDSKDDSNAYGSIEQVTQLFLTPELMALFDNTFGAGHTKPKLRTPLSRWPIAFAKAADKTIKCKSCKMTYFYDNKENGKYCCPYCSQTRDKFLKVSVQKTCEEEYVFVHEIYDEEIEIPSRCFEPFRIQKGDEAIIGITLKNDSLEIRKIKDNATIYIEFENGKEEILVGTRVIDKNKNFASFYKSSMAKKIFVELVEAEK